MFSNCVITNKSYLFRRILQYFRYKHKEHFGGFKAGSEQGLSDSVGSNVQQGSTIGHEADRFGSQIYSNFTIFFYV